MPRAPSTTIKAQSLLDELERRKLSGAISDKYLEQHTTTKGNKVLAFKNDLGGFTWYLPARDGQPEQWAKKGQPAPRTLRASPKAEGIHVKVFSQCFDMLTYLQVMGKADNECLISCEDQFGTVADSVSKDPKTKSVIFFGDGSAEHIFLLVRDRLINQDTGVHAIENLSEAYMDNPHKVSHSLQPQGIKHDLKQAQSQLLVAARLRPGA